MPIEEVSLIIDLMRPVRYIKHYTESTSQLVEAGTWFKALEISAKSSFCPLTFCVDIIL